MAGEHHKPMPPEALQLVADRFKVLSDPTRLGILQVLQAGPAPVSRLVEASGTSQPNISKHLKILQTGGLVKRKRQGNQVIYSIADPMIFELCGLVCSSLEHHFQSQAGRLDNDS